MEEQKQRQLAKKEPLWKRLFGINGRNGRNGTAEEDINKILNWPKKKEQEHAEIGSTYRDERGKRLKESEKVPPERVDSVDGSSMTPSAEGTGETPFALGTKAGTVPGKELSSMESQSVIESRQKERFKKKLKNRQTKPEGSTG